MQNEQFFRLCWIALKNTKPRMRSYMDSIEWDIAGRPKVREQIKRQQDHLENDDAKPAAFTPV